MKFLLRLKIKALKIVAVLSFLLMILFPVVFVNAAGVVDNLKNVGGKGETDIGLQSNLGDTLGTVIKGILALVGMIFLILMVYAGILWMTAGGTEEKSESAQKIITMAVIGLVVVMAAYAITAFVTISMGSTLPTK